MPPEKENSTVLIISQDFQIARDGKNMEFPALSVDDEEKV